VSAIDVLIERLTTEEGERLLPYDDATGKNVAAPVGNLSWGRGFNLMQCGTKDLFDLMERYLLTVLDAQLQHYAWYTSAGDVRASVFLDIAYNGGIHDLLGYPHMLAAAASGDWATAAANCTEKDPALDASRYAPLRALLLSGVSS
jgi:hypothetical protein